MTAAQKTAKANFKKAIEYRKKTGVSLKEAFAHVYGKKVGAAPKKKATPKKKAAPKKAVKKKVGALPVGFKGSIFDVSFKIVNQYDIYNDVSAIVEDVENGSTIVVYDGKGNANDKAQQFVSYIERKSRNKYSEKDIQSIKPRLVKFSNLMQKEVKEFNSGKKKTIKKQPLVITSPKKVVKKSAPKKAAVKKIARKKHTKYGKVKAHVRRVAGVHKDTKSHNVNIRVVSGLPSYKNAVRVYFSNPKYNYSTSVGPNVTEEEAKKYFLGKFFNVGVYPKEILQKPTRIKFFRYIDK